MSSAKRAPSAGHKRCLETTINLGFTWTTHACRAGQVLSGTWGPLPVRCTLLPDDRARVDGYDDQGGTGQPWTMLVYINDGRVTENCMYRLYNAETREQFEQRVFAKYAIKPGVYPVLPRIKNIP